MQQKHRNWRPLAVSAMLLFTTAASLSAQDRVTEQEVRQQLQQELRGRFQAEDPERKAEISSELSWLFRRDPTKLYAFVPTVINAKTAAELQPEVRQALTQHGERLFQLAKDYAESGREGDAYRMLFETLVVSPGHDGASMILGPTIADLVPPNLETTNAHGNAASGKDLWVATWRLGEGGYQSTFSVLSDANVEELKPILESLEHLYTVWDQVFFEYWSPPGRLTQAFLREEPLGRRVARKHSIVVFASQRDYIARLGGLAPNIEQSKGYYALRRRQSLFYLGDVDAERSWLHEASHQLFQERLSSRQNVGDDSNFWFVEGIALLMESLENHGQHATLGGMFCDRLQYARFNLFSRKFLRPLEELCEMGQQDFQRDTQVRQLYSQSAGVAQWLMTHEQAKYRKSAIQLLRLVYQSKAKPTSLFELLQQTADEANREYIEFLRPRKDILNQFPPEGDLDGLCLAYGDIDDESLKSLDGVSRLTWLDLSESPISDRGLLAVKRLQSLNQLFLTGTVVSDKGLPAIGELPNLQELDLSGTKVSDTGLVHLRRLKALTALSIADTKIDDEALSILKEMKSLQSLNARNTKLSEQAKTRLRAAISSVD